MTQNNILLAGHIGHLKKEGFPCCLIAQWQNFGVRSLSESDAAQLGFRVKVAERVYQSGSGIYFPFTSDFGQLRLDTPITRADGSVAKYLTPIGASSQAYLPTGCQDVTEGWKDAQAGTLLGRVTGALAGVSHYKALPPDSGLNIIFDADGWTNPDVAYHLFNAGLWTKGKIQLLPPIEGQPKAGLCEYRQAGYTADDYQALIESAFSPIEFLFEWASHFGDIPERKIGRAVKLVCQLAVRHLDNAQQLLLLKSIKKSSRLNLTDVLKPALNEARLRWRRSQQAPPKAHHPGELRADWKPPVSYLGTLGYWRTKNDNDIWEPRCNFDFVIDCELSDRDGGGFVLKVKPEWSSRSERVIIKNADKTTPEAFQEAVSKQIGSPVSVSLSKWELNSLFASKHADYRLVRDAKVFRVCERYGQLEDGLWVFSDRQFKADGTPTNERSSQTVFNRNLGIEDYIPCPVLAPDNGLGGIKALIDAARLVFGSEIHQFLLCLGWVVAGLQFQTIQKLEGAFPILNAYGNAGTGKTIAMEAALSVIGANWADEGMFSMATESALYERLKLTGSLPCCWDDPPREAHDVKRRQEFIKAMWNAKRRRTRGNEQKPHSPIALTTNHAEGEEQLAAYTRIVRVFFTAGINSEHFYSLKEAQKIASGSFSKLIGIGYRPDEIKPIEQRYLQGLGATHPRVAWSLALVTWYAQKVVDLVGRTENIQQWVSEHILPSENDAENSGDSLGDFIRLLTSLEAKDLVGSWNKREYQDNDGVSWMAIYATSCWNEVNKAFSPASYNKKSLKAQLLRSGGKEATVRFEQSRDLVLDYQRELRRWKPGTRTNSDGEEGENEPPKPPTTIQRKAWLVPIEYFDSFDRCNHFQEWCNQNSGGVTGCNENLVTPQNEVPVIVSALSNGRCNQCNQKEEEQRDLEKKFFPVQSPKDKDAEKIFSDGMGETNRRENLVTPVTEAELQSQQALPQVTDSGYPRLHPVTAVTPAQIDYSSYPHLTSNDIRASEKRAKKCKSAMLACTNQAELAAFHSEGGFSSSEIDWVYRNLLNDAEKDKVRSAAKSEQLDLFDPQASSHARTDTEREDLLLGARVVLKNKPALSGEVRSIELDGDKWIITVTFDDGTMAWFYRDQLIKLE